MKNRMFLIILFFCVNETFAQGTTHSYNKSLYNSSATLILENALVPKAVLTNSKDIFCVATNWTSQYPSIAAKIDSNGKIRWNNLSLSVPLKKDDTDGNANILPGSDGGVYFAFDYWEYRGREDLAEYYAYYPHIQYINAEGARMWGQTGIRLTNHPITFRGGATIRNISYSPDGNIIIYWTWVNVDVPKKGTNEYGTYVQKIDPSTGELKFGESGKKLFNSSAFPIIQGGNGNVYVFQAGDSVACYNSAAEKLWQLPLLTGVGNNFIAGTNDYNELIIIYGTNYYIHASLFDKDGAPIWSDKIISSTTGLIAYRTTQWSKNKWVITNYDGNVVSIICLDRNGNTCWGEMGKIVTDQTATCNPLDGESLLVAFQKLNPVGFYVRDLYIQKLDKNGNPVWQSGGIKVFENVNNNCVILPDQNGGAYLIFDALSTYDPTYIPRGSYIQKVDEDGNLGIITSIKNFENNTHTIPSLDCYPNPFNPNTTINYQLSEFSHVTLEVYDVLGREVAMLVNEKKSAGNYAFNFNAGNLSSGIYFCRLKADNTLITKKMIVLR